MGFRLYAGSRWIASAARGGARLRQIREGLQALGIEPNDILHHDTPRLFFGCRLQPNAFEALLGLSGDGLGVSNSAASIAMAWRRRWLSRRVSQPDVLEKLRSLGPHSVVRSLTLDKDDEQFYLPLFEQEPTPEELMVAAAEV